MRPKIENSAESPRRDVLFFLAVLHFTVYAYFWQWRGWNESARLILTYAIVDSGRLAVDALRTQSSDISYCNGHYYTCKPPGQSFVGVPVYALLGAAGVRHPESALSEFGQEPRRLREAAAMPLQNRYWWPDYVLTVCTSGVVTTATVILLYCASLKLGCSQKSAVLLAGSYGLGTPAITYATLYAGHQLAAFSAFASFMVLWASPSERKRGAAMFVAGLLAGCSVIAEYAMAPAAIALTVFAAWQAPGLRNMLCFILAATTCAVALGLYHSATFGAPWATPYQYCVVTEYREVYTASNPTGLMPPTIERATRILFSGRGLIWYAPAVILAPLGFVSLFRRARNVALLSAVAFGSYFLINSAHPTWEGGAATGPRYVQASIPFLMLPIASLLAVRGPVVRRAVAVLGVAGFIVCLACTAIPEGGRLPHLQPGGYEPLQNLVWDRLSTGQFGRNLGNVILYGHWTGPPSHNWWSLMPLLDLVLVLSAVMWWRVWERDVS